MLNFFSKLLGKPGCFIAGADIVMLQKCKDMEEACKLSKGINYCGATVPSNSTHLVLNFFCNRLPGYANGGGKKQETRSCSHHGFLPRWWA